MKEVCLSQDLFCKRCKKKLRNGIARYCLDCLEEIEFLRRKKELLKKLKVLTK